MKRLLIPMLAALLLLPSCADTDIPAETSADTLP